MHPAPSTESERQAVLLFCAPGRTGDHSPSPLTPKAWHSLVETLARNERTPGDLLGLTSDQMQSVGGIDGETADRLARLADRAGPLALELDRLSGRGVWAVTETDDAYPSRLRERLGPIAPPLLFGAGRRDLLSTGGLAIVGSRDAGEEALDFTTEVAAACVRGGMSVISGAARGVDSVAMSISVDHGGWAVGVLADSLERRIREPAVRRWMSEDQLCFVTPYRPSAGFSVGGAMGRNKIIYALSDAALVAAATKGSGGTWAGAVEALGSGWTSVLVANASANRDAAESLIAKGAVAFPANVPSILNAEELHRMTTADRDAMSDASDETVQATLFGESEPVKTTNRTSRRPK